MKLARDISFLHPMERNSRRRKALHLSCRVEAFRPRIVSGYDFGENAKNITEEAICEGKQGSYQVKGQDYVTAFVVAERILFFNIYGFYQCEVVKQR